MALNCFPIIQTSLFRMKRGNKDDVVLFSNENRNLLMGNAVKMAGVDIY